MMHLTVKGLLLPCLLLAALSLNDATGNPILDSTRQRRRLRKHKQEAFGLATKKGQRRKGSSKSKSKRSEYHVEGQQPPFLSEFEQYYDESTDEYSAAQVTSFPTPEYTAFPTSIQLDYPDYYEENHYEPDDEEEVVYDGKHNKYGKQKSSKAKSFKYKGYVATDAKTKQKESKHAMYATFKAYEERGKGSRYHKEKGHKQQTAGQGYNGYQVTKNHKGKKGDQDLPPGYGFISSSQQSKRSKSNNSCKKGKSGKKMGKNKYGYVDIHYVDNDASECGSKSRKGKGQSKSKKSRSKGKKMGMSKSKGSGYYPTPVAHTEFPTFVIDPSNQTDAPTFDPSMPEIPVDPDGSTAPVPAGAVVPTALPAPTEPEVSGPTMAPGNTPVELVPFGLLFDINREDIPSEEDYDAASQVVGQYIHMFMLEMYPSGAVSTYVTGELIPGSIAYSLISGALRDYSGTLEFSDAGEIPLPETLDEDLNVAFSGDNVQVFLDMLATLPPENLFSTATNVRKVENSMMNQAARRRKESRPARYTVRKTAYIAAAFGVIAVVMYGGVSMVMQHRRRQIIQKGDFFGGDDITFDGTFVR